MSQPVKLSDALILDARLMAALAERSIAGQIEFWARLGRAVEPMLTGDKSMALRKLGDTRPLSELVSSVDSPEGRKRVTDFLDHQPYPHYESIPGNSGTLMRVEADGTRTVGRFVNREFRACKLRAHRASAGAKSVPKMPGRRKQ